MASMLAEPRLAGLFQTASMLAMHTVTAVLEQPSSGRIARQMLGRRNIVLSQSDELNDPLDC